MNGVKTMNVGSTKMMGEGTEHPGIGSNHIRVIRSLHNSIQNNIQTNGSEDSLKWTLTDLAEHDPSKSDQTKKEQGHHAKDMYP
jgi:hypothetical protein